MILNLTRTGGEDGELGAGERDHAKPKAKVEEDRIRVEENERLGGERSRRHGV